MNDIKEGEDFPHGIYFTWQERHISELRW